MYFKHKVFGLIFNIFSKCSVKKNRVSFVLDSFGGNLDFIASEFEKKGDFEFNYFYKNKFSLISFHKLATSKYIFLDNNFFPMAFMNFNKESIIIQLWHAPGVFKRFGASSNPEFKPILKKISDKTNYLMVSSSNIIDFYSEAFQMDKSKIKPLGLPRSDYFFKNHNNLKGDFYNSYPEARGKKLVLYVPTFRDNEKFNNVFNYLDLDNFNKELGDEYILLLRLHPKVNIDLDSGRYINCNDYEDISKLLLISDILITDYSSLMIEFAILNRPIIFFTYDFNEYVRKDRNFYFDFKENVPGTIVTSSDELIKTIKNENYNLNKIQDFVKYQFNELDGKASSRIVDFVLNNEG